MSLQKVLCNRHILQVLLSPSEFPVSYSKVQPAAEHVLHFQPLTALAAACPQRAGCCAAMVWEEKTQHLCLVQTSGLLEQSEKLELAAVRQTANPSPMQRDWQQLSSQWPQIMGR